MRRTARAFRVGICYHLVNRGDVRGVSWDSNRWQVRTAHRLGLESSLRPRGRPRKDKGK